MADLSSFATKDKSEEGKWFPVKIDGTKYPIALLIYGDDSDIVQDFDRERVRKLGKSGIGNGKEIDDEVIDELYESKDEGVLIRIGGISSYDWKKKTNIDEQITIGEVVIGNDKKSFAYLIDKIPAIKDFVTEKSKRSNFLD